MGARNINNVNNCAMGVLPCMGTNYPRYVWIIYAKMFENSVPLGCLFASIFIMASGCCLLMSLTCSPIIIIIQPRYIWSDHVIYLVRSRDSSSRYAFLGDVMSCLNCRMFTIGLLTLLTPFSRNHSDRNLHIHES